MELVGTLFATAATAGATAAGAAVPIVGAAGTMAVPTFLAGASASGSTALSVLSGVASGFSALASLGQGIAGSLKSQEERRQLEFRAREELVVGETEAAAAKKQLVATMGKQTVGYAASGVDLSAGTVASAREQAISDAEADIRRIRYGSRSRATLYQRKAAQAKADGNLALATGILGAGGDLAGAGIDLLGRG